MDLTFDLANCLRDILTRVGVDDPLILQICVAFIFFILSFIAGWIIYHIFEHYFTKWAKNTKTTLDDEIIKNVKKPVYFLVILIGFYYGIDQLTALDVYSTILVQIFSVAQIFLAAFIITRVINVFVSWYAEKNRQKRQVDNRILNVFKKFIQGIVYLIAFLVILNAFNVDLSGVVIGVGVGGIAIAFALQSILGDVFSAFSIYFDKPFEVGDFIVVGQHSGTVTKIGMKSTRIQLLQGEEMIVSNREITSGSVRNFRKMTRRRVDFIIRISPTTSIVKLKKIPKLIEKIIRNCESTDFYMVHLREIGSFSYNYEVVYYINTGDYNTFLDIHEKVNFAIREAFEKEGIDFGFQSRAPSST